MGEILDESSIKPSVAQKTPHPFDICRGWQLLDNLYLYSIHFFPSFGHSMSEDNPLSDHEMALFPIKDQVRVLTSLENFIQILKAFVKALSIDREIIHENFHDVLDQAREDPHHTRWKDAGALQRPKDIRR